MVRARPWTVHTAGHPVRTVQRCARCGEVLLEQLAFDQHPAWFEIGTHVTGAGKCATAIPAGQPLEVDEQLCWAA